MAQEDRTFTVTLVDKNGTLDEVVKTEEEDGGAKKEVHSKKFKKRALRTEYRNSMKDPSKFPQTDIADMNHPTIILREGKPDQVTFFCFEEFVISVLRDPEILEDGGPPEGPFTNSGGNVFTFEIGQDQGGGPSPTKFKAGPYKSAAKANIQRFWKFSVVTKSGLTLDPCIIID